jgi:hypothetical protein
MTMTRRQTVLNKRPNLNKINVTSKNVHINRCFMVFK